MRSARHERVLPWSWPEGARVLLALVAIMAAIGLALGRRELTRGSASGVVVSELKLDPSTAMPGALAALPRIGPALARRIVAARADGPFRSPTDLRARVRGIGPATWARIEPYLRFDAGPPFDPSLDSRAIAIVDDGGKPGVPTASSPRKPARSRTRRAKGAPVQLTAKVGAVPPP